MTNQTTDYQLIVNSDLDSFNESVNKLIKEGFKPRYPFQKLGDLYHLEMMKKEESLTNFKNVLDIIQPLIEKIVGGNSFKDKMNIESLFNEIAEIDGTEKAYMGIANAIARGNTDVYNNLLIEFNRLKPTTEEQFHKIIQSIIKR